MTLTIELAPDIEMTVRQQAAKNGQNVADFVLQAVNEKITKSRSFEEICAPFARAVAASGMSDEEFDAFFEEAREAVWQEKHGNKP